MVINYSFFFEDERNIMEELPWSLKSIKLFSWNVDFSSQDIDIFICCSLSKKIFFDFRGTIDYMIWNADCKLFEEPLVCPRF